MFNSFINFILLLQTNPLPIKEKCQSVHITGHCHVWVLCFGPYIVWVLCFGPYITFTFDLWD